MISYDASNRLKVILSYQGTILPSVISYMVWMLLWTGSLLFVFKFFELQFELGSQLHTFLGVALVFLLVMRTNSSYTVFISWNHSLKIVSHVFWKIIYI